MSIGVPIKVLHEAEGHIVTCETNTGEVYRGKLIEAEDNMNCQVAVSPPPAGRTDGRGREAFSALIHAQCFAECLLCCSFTGWAGIGPMGFWES